MSTEGCSVHRERLGEFLVGALDPEASAAVERHLGECRTCGAELAELQRLEGILWSIEPARTGSRFRAWAVAAAAAAILLAVIVVFVAPRRPPRLIEGEIAGLPPASAQPPVPYGRGLAGVRPSLIEFPDGSIIEAMAGARFALEGPRSVRLDLGEAFFHVRDGAGGFEVHTPRGTARVLGTSFLVQVKEEPVMNGTVVKAAGAAAVTVAVVTGTVLWVSSDGSTTRIDAGKSATARDGALELRETRAEVERLREERKAAAEEKEKLEAKNVALEKQVASLSSEVAELREEAAGEAEDGTVEPLAIAFGEGQDLEEIVSADWREMGEAAENVMKLVDEVFESGKPIEEAPPDLLLRIATENQKLFPFSLKLAGKLPTHAPLNGEFTHPIAHWNLIAEHLRFAGVPLSKGQLRRIARLGGQYENEWERLEASYSDDTLKLEKLIDELDLKKRYLDRVEALLSGEQRRVVASEKVHHVHLLDLHSPMVIVSVLARPIAGESREKLREQAIEQWASAWGIDAGKLAERPDLIEEWFSRLESRLAPVSMVEAARFRIDDALAAGRAQVELMGRILRASLADEASASKMRTETLFLVPRLLAGG
jgi:anti-sigma factor RsiW